VYTWFFSCIRPYRTPLIAALLIVFLVTVLGMVNPILSGPLVDRVLVKGETGILLPLLAIMVATVFVKSALRLAFLYLFERCSQATIKRMRNKLFARVQAMDAAWHDKTRTGDLMAHLTGDIDAVRHFVAWVVYQTMENGGIFVLGVVVLCSVNLPFTLLLLACAPFVAWAAIMLSRTVLPTFSRIRDEFSHLNATVQENIAGHRLVRAFVREDHEIAKFGVANDAFRARNIESAEVWARYIPLIELGSGLLMVVLLLAGGVFVIQGRLTLGQLAVFNSLVWALTNPLRMAGWLVNDTQRFRASLERLYALSKVESDLCNQNKTMAPPQGRKARGCVEFQSVNLYFGEQRILYDVSFQAEEGQTIGVVGPTGSGKTALLSLIPRFRDASGGSVLVDATDVRQWNLQELRQSAGIAMQDVFLFSDTLRGNIAFARPEADEKAIHTAATMANVHEFADDLPARYDTVVGERGIGLSGGQRQRVALARLWLADPTIMILDDTTSAVDRETEARLQQSIRTLHGTHTVFLAAHRLSSVKHADLILVLQDGRVSERGTHEQLLRAGGWYATVWEHQEGNEVHHGA